MTRARVMVFMTIVSILMLAPATVLAHGIGGRQDLNIPLEYFIVGAGIVLVVTFAGLAALWTEPRLQTPPQGRVIESPLLRLGAVLLGVLGLVGLLLVVLTGAIGTQSSARNPAPVLVFVWFWLVLPFGAALLGDLYPAADPWRWVRPLFGVTDNRDAPSGSLVPATVVLILFVWLEIIGQLASPFDQPRVLALVAVLYTVYLMWAAGRGRRADDADGFFAYTRYLGSLGPIGHDDTGQPAWFGWFRRIPTIPEQRGMVGFVTAMIATVTFDGAGGTDGWLSVFETPVIGLLETIGVGATSALVATKTIGLLLVFFIIYGAYMAACWVAARFGGAGDARTVAIRFAHTLVPIAFAYAFAHYFTLVLFESQILLSTISDPFGLGWDLFGTADRPIDFSLIQGGSVWVWYVQLAAIVGGHILGVTLSHDRALADFDGPGAIRSQYAMLVLMVFLTGLGLAILSS